MTYIKKTITIKDKHEDWLHENSTNLSRFVQKIIDNKIIDNKNKLRFSQKIVTYLMENLTVHFFKEDKIVNIKDIKKFSISCPKLFFMPHSEFYERFLIEDADIKEYELRIKERFILPKGKKRLQVLKNDNFKCVFCGRGKGETKLHIDHIIPKSKGGTDDIENLQTLCSECNLSKSDNLEFLVRLLSKN